jgi:regulator of protease activity HflC (stomatin/prohibitin superfamily)
MTASLIVVGIAALVVLVTLARAVQIIPQAHAAVIERFGRYIRTLDAGLHTIVPFVDRRRRLVDLREQVIAFPPQPVITVDNVTMSIDTVFYFSVIDPVRATYGVANLLDAIEQLTITTLRNVIGALSLDQVLTSRDHINADLREVLDEATARWGIRVTRTELKSIDPPASIQQAMEKQMRAERDKRAAILNAEGEKQAAILTAEGARQARILRAEAEQQAEVLIADGDRRAKVLRADGDAEAILRVFQAIHEGRATPEVLAYAYLQVLPEVADGQSTKLLMIPSDALSSIAAAAALGAGLQIGNGAVPGAPAVPSAPAAPGAQGAS